MTANPTDKPRLPDNASEIKEYNITIPITSPRLLVDTVRLLREHYYFDQIPTSWIDILTAKSHNTDQNSQPETPKKSAIPTTLVQLQEALEKIPDEIYITIPIKEQTEITSTLNILKQHFDILKIPEYLLQLPPLPEPTWDIFI